MKYQKLLITVVFAFLLSATIAWADTISVTLTPCTATPCSPGQFDTSQTVALGTTQVEFDASISSPSQTLFLNSDAPTTTSTLLSIDDSPYNNNFPSSLGASAVGPFALFNVDLDPSTGVGTYTGVFSIIGGPDTGTFDDLADVDFSITVQNATAVPEPRSMLLVPTGLFIIWLFSRKRVSSVEVRI